MRDGVIKYFKAKFLLIFLGLISFSAKATHISGADFNYQCVGQDSFWVTLNLFRDCTGIGAPRNANVDFFSSCGQSFSVRLTKQNGANGTEISQLCPGSLNQSTCSGGALPGMQQHIYGALVVLSPVCDFWTMQWGLCCRNTTVNLVGQPEMLVNATLYSQTDSCNNSPVFNAQPILYVCLNQNVNYNFAVTEADGDSLFYRFIEPLDQMVGGTAQAVNFIPGYTFTSPIPGIILNSATGQLQFTPTIQGNFVLAVEVCEYDYVTGALQGCVIRDIQFVIIQCANLPPEPPVIGISSFTGTGSLMAPDSVLVCEGNTFNFDIVFTDPNVADSIILTTNVAQVIPGATFSITNGNPATVHISGTATSNMPIQNTFVVNANDGACPIPATATSAYNIIVQPKPIVNAGGDQIVCKSNLPVNIAGSIQNATGGIWSGAGAFGNNVTQLNTTYTPTPAEIMAGSAQLILSSTGNQNCSQVHDTIEVQLVSFDASLTIAITDVSCHAGTDGEIGISYLGGVLPINVVWNTTPVQIGDTATNLGAGTYTATLTDGNGCDTMITATIAEPTALTSSVQSVLNVTCTGGNNGSATLAINGGVTPYTYLWSVSAQSQTTLTANNLFAATHQVSISDANGCVVVQTVNVVQPNYPMGVNVTTSDVICFGDSDGSASAIPWGGTAPYNFTWGPNGQTANPLTNISGGVYSITVVDNSGMCVVQTGIIVNEPVQITGVNSSTSILCHGDTTGIVSFIPNGGTAPFAYQWGANAGNLTTNTVSNLGVGFYALTLTDGNGCIFDTTVGITEPNKLMVNVSQSIVSCNGGNNGTASVALTGGVLPYTINWNTTPVQTSLTASNLITGSYQANIIDAQGCDTSISVTIIEPTVLSGTIVSQTDVSCTGGFNGEATVSGVGGMPPYSYQWGVNAQSATTATVDSLFAGNYSITITDTLGCTFIQNLTLTQPIFALTVNLSVTDITCNGLINGSVTAIASGGTGPYGYNWMPSNQSGATISNLPVSSNTITVTDNSGQCIVQTGIQINQPEPISTLGITNPVLCFGGNTGNASVNGYGGVRPFTYQWDANTGSQTDSVANNLTANTFSFSITDANGCAYDSTVIVDQPDALAMAGNPIQPLCFGNANGSIDAVVLGGVAPFSFIWDANAANQTTQVATGLVIGSYSVSISDSNGCNLDSVFTLLEPSPLTTGLINLTPVGCFGDSTGMVTIVGAGGVGPYDYTWNTSSGLEASGSVFGLYAGTYTVTVSDTNGCEFDTMIVMTQPNAPLSILSTEINVACFGDSTASITAIPSGGTTPYLYQWDSIAWNQTTAIASGLFPGSFEVFVTDSNGCTDSLLADITQPTSPLSVTVSSTDVLCYGDSTGIASASGIGGTSPYSYQWDAFANNQITATADSLPIGTFAVTVTDTLGCTSDTVMEVFEPSALAMSVISTLPLCKDGTDGALQALATGGVGPFSYVWDANAGNQTTSMATGLGAGSYEVIVTDSNGCSLDSIFILDEPTLLTATVTHMESVGCFADSSGAAAVLALGGTAPYVYQWNTMIQPLDTGYVVNLWAGAHVVTVTDTNGCVFDTNVIITQPLAALTISNTTLNVACFGDSTASITAILSGGTTPYLYQWDSLAFNQTTAIATGLYQGSFQVMVTDSNGCTDSLLAVITQPTNPLSVTVSSTDVLCYGDSTGTASASGIGGTSPYSYQWDAFANNQITATAGSLPIGTYSVTVTDTLGCISDTVMEVIEPDSLEFTGVSINNVNCYGGQDASATMIIIGGVTPYVYNWGISANNQTSSMASNLVAGMHRVIVSDSNGCSIDSLIEILQPQISLQLDSNQLGVSCFGGSDGVAIALLSGGTSPYSCYWNGSPNVGGDSLVNVIAGWNKVWVIDANGCLDSLMVEVLEPSLLLATETQNIPVSCFGNLEGSATVLGSGGVFPYQYQWPINANYQTDSTANQLGYGSYIVTVTDTNGCNTQTTVFITQPQAALTNSVTITIPLCYNDTNGNLVSTPMGGTAPYSYQWSASLNSQMDSVNQVGAGNYSVTITDTNGCTAQTIIQVTEPVQLTISSLTSRSALCYGDNSGISEVIVTGGTLPYTYGWGASSNYQSTATAVNLSTGTYQVIITDLNGCEIDSNIWVDQPTDSLNIMGTPTDVSCFSGTSGAIATTVTGGTQPYVVSWGVNVTNPVGANAINLPQGTYEAFVIDANGCLDTVSVVISQPSTPISMTANSLDVSCFSYSDGSATLNITGGTLPYLCSWGANSGFQVGSGAGNLNAGNYSGYVTDGNGCQDSLGITVDQPMPITLQVTPDNIVCTQTNFNVEAFVTGGDGNYSYAWNNGLPNLDFHTVSPIGSTVYSVSVTDGIGCPGQSASITITVFQIQSDSLTAWTDGDICLGESSNLFANYASQFAGFTYQWSHGLGTGSGPKSVSPVQTTIYQVTATDQCGSSVSDFVVVNILQAPVVNLPEIVAQGCGPLTVLFEDHINDSGTFSYVWNFGDGTSSNLKNPSHTYTQAGTYPVSVTKISTLGCQGQLSGPSSVTVYPTPVAYGVADKYITDITQPTFNLTDQSTGANSILWEFSPIDFATTPNTSYMYPDTGTYFVLLTASNSYGCVSDFEFSVAVISQNQLSVPNAFTPNPSGGNGGSYDASSLSNEVFFARMGSVSQFHMIVYNRWGELIFETFDVNVGWDGYYRGELSPQDVYVWKIEAHFEDGSQVSDVGSLTLLR